MQKIRLEKLIFFMLIITTILSILGDLEIIIYEIGMVSDDITILLCITYFIFYSSLFKSDQIFTTKFIERIYGNVV